MVNIRVCGASARAISSAMTIRCRNVSPAPPYSRGQCAMARPTLLRSAIHQRWKAMNSSFEAFAIRAFQSGGTTSASQSRIALRKAGRSCWASRMCHSPSSNAERPARSIAASPAAARSRRHGIRHDQHFVQACALEEDVRIEVPGESNAAVQLHAIGGRRRQRLPSLRPWRGKPRYPHRARPRRCDERRARPSRPSSPVSWRDRRRDASAPGIRRSAARIARAFSYMRWFVR